MASFVWPPRHRRGVCSMASPAARSVDVRGAFLADGGPFEARFSPDVCDASFEACESSGEAFRAWPFLSGTENCICQPSRACRSEPFVGASALATNL